MRAGKGLNYISSMSRDLQQPIPPLKVEKIRKYQDNKNKHFGLLIFDDKIAEKYLAPNAKFK